MPILTVPNTDPNDSAVLATSAGLALQADTTSLGDAAIIARSLDTTLGSTGASVAAETHGGGAGVVARQTNQAARQPALFAEVQGLGHAIHATVNNPTGDGYALYAEHTGDGEAKRAAFFHGNVVVTGDVSFPGADCAEEFLIGSEAGVEPGVLMAIGPSGSLVLTAEPYDTRVVGVVAGAGDLRPGIVMGRGLAGAAPVRAIALVGRTWCKVDASFDPIALGDLLTSSATPGHAMRATDPTRAFGAVIGKALEPLDAGRGMIPILIALQ